MGNTIDSRPVFSREASPCSRPSTPVSSLLYQAKFSSEMLARVVRILLRYDPQAVCRFLCSSRFLQQIVREGSDEAPSGRRTHPHRDVPSTEHHVLVQLAHTRASPLYSAQSACGLHDVPHGPLRLPVHQREPRQRACHSPSCSLLAVCHRRRQTTMHRRCGGSGSTLRYARWGTCCRPDT